MTLNNGRRLYQGRAGTSTAALVFGGFGSNSRESVTESWNGTNWTEVADLNTAIRQAAGAGTNTAALSFGGEDAASAEIKTTEEWNFTGGIQTIGDS